jgi:hypothetical protein
MKRLAAILTGLTLLLGSSAALAQPAPSGRAFYDKRPTIYEYLEADEVVGEIGGPMSDIDSSRLAALFDSLVHPRHDYYAEILKAAEDI